MLTGLEILLARMKTNPEEFLKDNSVPYEGEAFGGKWSDLLDYGWRVANEEERKALQDAKIDFYRDDFNERVMKRLAGEEQEQEEHPMQKFRIKTPTQNVMVSAGGTGGSGSSGSAKSMLSQQGAQQARASLAQTGATISTDSSFWNGVITSGKGKL
jgi:hypothetical protein